MHVLRRNLRQKLFARLHPQLHKLHRLPDTARRLHLVAVRGIDVRGQRQHAVLFGGIGRDAGLAIAIDDREAGSLGHDAVIGRLVVDRFQENDQFGIFGHDLDADGALSRRR